MTTDPAGPADTRMMGIVHGALRRDLERARLVLEAGDVPDTRRAALAEHLVWAMDFLHHHHQGEDTGLYPMIRRKDPSLAPVLDAMDEEHHAITPAMDEVTAAARAWADDPGRQERVAAAVAALRTVLDPHLRHEEVEMMPLVERTLTHHEHEDWEQTYNVKPKKTTQLAFEGHWIVDNANPEDRSTVLHLVPPVPRFLLVNLMGRPYAQRREALWAGTPAADVPLLTLAELERRG
ncbi:hemerythrin domain-containing protein [Nocardioides anomalus]|uniref:Hemerythrin domain-containing protein n=1 Tax=Nocardioides anomalus TaxID=2712223 RepID=A0A6G6WJK3_9ACTN|nr:hemerythrin domain-containing protein [Nocardioides anomalus]QIG45386.1 hemerythrin domain-containing protein [Nocardioides anomalus]